VGSRYWFTCNKGFTLIGPVTIHCGKNGQWNETLPECAKGKETKKNVDRKSIVNSKSKKNKYIDSHLQTVLC